MLAENFQKSGLVFKLIQMAFLGRRPAHELPGLHARLVDRSAWCMVDHGMPTGGLVLLASWPHQQYIAIRFQSAAAVQLARQWGPAIGP